MSSIEENREESVQEMRRAMGTLPSEAPKLKTEFRHLEEINIRLVSKPDNPYRAIFESSTATWGDDQYKLKWNRVSPENRFKVVAAALTGNTLPQAIEVVSFLFQVRGTPRWLFEEHAREMSQFTTYLSVGCRDNNKLDASMVVENIDSPDLDVDYFRLAKDNYRQIIEEGQESWQSARTVLPLGYHHPYLFYTSLLCLQMNYRKFLRKKEEYDGLNILLGECISAVGRSFPLIEACVRGVDGDIEDCWWELGKVDVAAFREEG